MFMCELKKKFVVAVLCDLEAKVEAQQILAICNYKSGEEERL